MGINGLGIWREGDRFLETEPKNKNSTIGHGGEREWRDGSA